MIFHLPSPSSSSSSSSRQNMIRSSHKIVSQKMKLKSKNAIYLTAAAALSPCSQAWVIDPSIYFLQRQSMHISTTPATNRGVLPVAGQELFPKRASHESMRLYSRKSNDEDNGIISKVGDAVKSILPTKWFSTKEEKAALTRREEVKENISGGLNEMLKDAPLPLKMMGKIAAPLLSTMASSLAETMADQQRTTAAVLEDARGYLMNDPAVTSLLGDSISVGNPFSQSSSTTNINGQTQSRVELAMPVSGSRGSGVARLVASQEEISQLVVEAGGSAINVNLTKQKFASSGGGSSYSSSRDDDNIIEAEIIDKETKN